MNKHTHNPIESTARMVDGCQNKAQPDCSQPVNRPCGTTGQHVYYDCRCGAVGVACPSRRHITWHEGRL